MADEEDNGYMRKLFRGAAFAVAAASVLLLAACAAGDVEVEQLTDDLIGYSSELEGAEINSITVLDSVMSEDEEELKVTVEADYVADEVHSICYYELTYKREGAKWAFSYGDTVRIED